MVGDCAAHRLDRFFAGQIEMRDLAARVDPGVGAAGALHHGALASEGEDGLLERRLNRLAVVLSLPTTGPMLLNALKSQDMYLAGSFLMFLATLIVIGVLISDLALVALDPRIRLQGGVAR